MNINESLTMEKLQLRSTPKRDIKISASQIAKRIFRQSAEAGAPYEGMTSKKWAKKWLASPEFVLTTISARYAAPTVPAPSSVNKVIENMQAASDALDPIVVDVNKNRVGGAHGSGYVPSVIIVDGKHRYFAELAKGRERIKAWVGVNALPNVQRIEIAASAKRIRPSGHKVDTQMLYAAASSMPVQVPRQDVGDGGSAPTMRMPAVKSEGAPMEPFTKGQRPVVKATGGAAGGMGTTGGPGGNTSGANPNRLGIYSKRKMKADADPSDRDSVVDPSDRNWPPDPSDRKSGFPGGQQDPTVQSPGSGVGNRTKPSTGASNSALSRVGMGMRTKPQAGASNSELSKILGGNKMVKKMWNE